MQNEEVHRPWTAETEATLRAAGWTPQRAAFERVQKSRFDFGGLRMSPAAKRALDEFGGLRASQSGAGEQCARGGFVIEPELAAGEEDRFAAFSEFVAGALFPLGEAHDGHAFLGIDESGAVYLVGDSLRRLGNDIYAALDALLRGLNSTMVAPHGRW